MPNRKEPTISGFSAIKDDVDQRSEHRGEIRGRAPDAERTVKKKHASASQRDSAGRQYPASSSSTPVVKERVVVKSKASPFLFLLLLVVAGFSGFTYWQLLESNKLLVVAGERITELEGQLALTDDESTASLTAVQAKLKWADSEIRKLWGVSYDTNKKAIAKNKSNIDSLTGRVTRLKKDLPAAVDEKVKGFTGEISLLNELVSANQASVAAIENNASGWLNQSRSLKDQVIQLQNKEAQLQRSLKQVQQDIESINNFRRDINQWRLSTEGGAQ